VWFFGRFAVLAAFIVLMACETSPISSEVASPTDPSSGISEVAPAARTTQAASAPPAPSTDPATSAPDDLATSPPESTTPPTEPPPPATDPPPTAPAPPTTTIPYATAVRAALEGSGFSPDMTDCYVYLAVTDRDSGIELDAERSNELVSICLQLTAPTTSSPPPTIPPVAVAALPSNPCDPNYTGCVPIDSDVDCRGGSGNGPSYTGPVEVVGADIYDLDRDNDGLACE